MELNESSETSEQPKSDEQAREGAQLDQFRKLLSEAGESHEGEAGESQQNAEPKAGKPKGKPKALKDLAETLSLEDKDLYAIEVPMADGKTLSIGALKDAAAKSDDLSVRELAFAERVTKQEAEWTRSQQEFAELMSQLDPKAIKPEVTAKVREKIAASQKRERALVLQTIPEWQNETVRDADLVGMVEYLKDFGIHESYLTATMNHKLFRLVRDGYLRKQRIDKALAQVEAVKKPSTTGKSSAGNGAARKPQASTPTRSGGMQERFRSILSQG
jgi:hypothetical protein